MAFNDINFYEHQFRKLSELKEEAKGGYIEDSKIGIDTTIPEGCEKFELELFQDNSILNNPKPHPHILYITPFKGGTKLERKICRDSCRYFFTFVYSPNFCHRNQLSKNLYNLF